MPLQVSGSLVCDTKYSNRSDPGSESSGQLKRALFVSGDAALIPVDCASSRAGLTPPQASRVTDPRQLSVELLNTRYDMIVIDTQTLPDSCPKLCRKVRSLQPDTRILVLAHVANLGKVVEYLEAGADAVIGRDYFSEQLANTPDCWSRLTACQFSPDVWQLVYNALSDFQLMFGEAAPSDSTADDAPIAGLLSTRECELLRLGATGMCARQLATALHLSTHTVNTHLKNIYRKLGVNRRGAAIQKARELGEI